MSLVFTGRPPTAAVAPPPAAAVVASSDTVRGISSRDQIIWDLYRSLARGDFHHDFGERTATRDLITAGDENRFFELAKNVSTKGAVFLRTEFKNKYVGKTLYELLASTFDRMLVPAIGFSTEDMTFPDEVGLLRRIGVDFGNIKDRMARNETISDLNVNAGSGLTRTYTVRSSSYREGPRPPAGDQATYKRNRNISTMFREVTGGKQNFAVIVDATGGLPLTEILNASLRPDPEAPCNFFVIQNIENSSDSADKVQHIKPTAGSNQAKLFYLRDNENTVVYPLWGLGELDQKSNIFASMKISLTRMTDGTVEADILAGSDTFHIGDVANASNVKNATLKAVAVMIEKGKVPEVFVYTLIKRMGDWCQALSLLDMDRIYSMFDQAGNFGGTMTLRERLVDTEIGVVTNDRILLAFCLLHGLNVFFTSAMDLARLIYFKNNNDVPDGPALKDRANAIFAQFQSGYSGIKPNVDQLAASLAAVLETARSSIVASTTLPEYIGLLKNFTMNVSKLDAASLNPFDARPEKAEIDKVASEFLRSGDATAAFSVANKLSAQLAKLENSVTIANDRMIALNNNSYPGQLTVRIRLQALAAKLTMGRAPTSATMVEARDILLGIREDIELIRNKGTVSDDILRQLLTPTFAIPDGRQGDNHRAVLSGLDPIRLIIPSAPSGQAGGGGQRGGATLDDLFNALCTRKILLIPMGTPEVTSRTNVYVQGDDYVDDKLRVYTVVDEYIVTREDDPIFTMFFDLPQELPETPQVMYICRRYMLLQFDILRQKYEQFTETFSNSETRVGEENVGLVALDTDDGTIRSGTQQDDNLKEMSYVIQLILSTLRGFSFQAVQTYYRNARLEAVTGRPIESPVIDIPAAIGQCRIVFAGMFPAAVATIPASNDQNFFGLSEYYENIILTTAGARLAGSMFAVTTVVDGAQFLTEQGVLLQTAIVDAVANQDEAVPIDPEAVNTRVATSLTAWLTERGIPSGPLVDEISQRLATAQTQRPRGGRKTHRRRGLPKLV
jgi:hypothetical protein